MASGVFGNIHDDHGVAGRATFYPDVAGADSSRGFGVQLFFQGTGAAIHKNLCKVGVERGAAARAGVMAAPFEEVEADSLFGIKIDPGKIVIGIAIFRAEPHDGVGALLKIGRADGDIEDRELRPLVAFGCAVEEIDRAGSF